jgi:hypothetical protein
MGLISMGEKGKQLHRPALHQIPSFVNTGTLAYEDLSLQTQTWREKQIGLFLLGQFLNNKFVLKSNPDGK